MSQTIGEYAQQKATAEIILSGRAEVMRDIAPVIEMGMPMEFIIKMMKDKAHAELSNSKEVEAGLFLIECWIREAYEKKEKEDNG